MKVELDVYRVWGQPKIHKPSALKGIKPTFTILFRKRKNQVYILGKDIYVYFFDLFSRPHGFPDAEDMALPLSALQKKYPDYFNNIIKNERFLYADTWATILDRNEGYVKFTGLITAIEECGYLPKLSYDLSSEFCELSKLNPRFEVSDFIHLHGSYADYFRFINDMIYMIKMQYNDNRNSNIRRRCRKRI